MPTNNYILTSNGNFIGEDELYHYGVVGMKWGVRKASYYDAKNRDHVSKMSTSKSRLGKEYHNYRAYRNEVKSGAKKATDSLRNQGFSSVKKILGAIDNVYGHGALSRAQSASANYYDRQAAYAKTRLQKTRSKSAAFNSRTTAILNQRLHDSKNLKEYGKTYVNALVNKPVKTWSGRTTTNGKQFVDRMLAFGVVGTIKDISYYTKHRD